MAQKVRIRLVTIGYLPHDFHIEKIIQWWSEVFQLCGSIDNFALRHDSDAEDWEYSDSLISELISKLPTKSKDIDFVVALVNVPIENGWYTRLFDNGNIVITLHEIKDVLRNSNIPLENVVLRLLYAYSLIFWQHEARIPTLSEVVDSFHEETRGCLFDFTAYKSDLPASCDKPKICDACQERLRTLSVSNDVIETTNKEIHTISKGYYYRIVDFVKQHPVWTLIISSAYAVLLNIIASLIYSK